MVAVKRHAPRLFKPALAPLSAVGWFLLRVIGVPVYRLFFGVKRGIDRLLLPAKHRITFLVSNRYALHVAVVAIAAMTGSIHLGASDVRAESFGTKSMLYGLVAQDANAAVETVSADTLPESTRVSYGYDDGALDPTTHFDTLSLGDAYVTTTVGGSAVTVPAISEGRPIAASRSETESYKVTDGDTLYGIAERFDLSLSTILWANNLTVRSLIKPGQTLTIPAVDGVLYTVKSGDTLLKIAKTYGSDTDEIITVNQLASANDLRIGQSLILPGGEPPASASSPVKATPAPVSSIFTKPPATATTAPSTTTKGSGSGTGTWLWPTDWRVITQYYGWQHTGVDIDGDYTTQSYAAADGVVIYSGWRNGYGNTVEIDHGDGLVTRYAHHSKLYVKAGDVVTQGQAIAQTGTTGKSTGTHLHFEVIKNGKFQNPLDYVR